MYGIAASSAAASAAHEGGAEKSGGVLHQGSGFMTTMYRFACYPRSSQWDSLNLDIDDRNILFHVSIRPDLKQIIVNDLVEGNWGEERKLPFDPSGVEYLPLTVIDAGARLHLLLGGELRASAEPKRARGEAVGIRASMPWTASAPFGPFAAPDGAWLPPEGIGPEALRGFIASPGWAGGPVTIAIGAVRLAAQAMPVPTAPGLPTGFVVPLDAEAGEALSRAQREHRHATAVVVHFAGAVSAHGLLNPPGLVERLRPGRITGWLRSRGAPPRLTLRVDGVTTPAQGAIGGEPDFPGDSFIAGRREREASEDYAPERRIAFSLDLPPSLRTGMIEVLADGVELEGGPLVLGQAGPEPAAETPPPPAAATSAFAMQDDAVEVLRMDVPPGGGEDLWLDLVAPNGDIPLHVRYRAAENWLVTNHCLGGSWGSETVLGRLPSTWFRVVVDLEIAGGRCVVAVNHEPWGEIHSIPLGGQTLSVHGPHQRFVRLGARTGTMPPAAPAIGAVDHVDGGRLHGWAVGAPADAPLLVDLGEGPVALRPEWTPMPALATRLRREDPRIGFQAAMPRGLAERLSEGWRSARVTLGDAPLTLPPPWTSAVVEIDGFTLRGEVIGGDGAGPRIGLLLAGKPLDLASVQWEEPPLPPLRGEGPGQVRHGFEIELPGIIWCGLAPDAGAVLAVTVNGRIIEPGELLFTRAMALQALIEAARQGDGTVATQGRALVAVEHLAFGRFLPDLPPPAADFMRDFAHRMKLDAFIQREAGPAPEAGATATPSPTPEDRQRITIWRALRAVNDLMAGDGGRVFDHARAVDDSWELAGEAREHFWFGLVPTLCASDELPRLASVIPLSTWVRHEHAGDAWSLSSAVAMLAAAGEAGRAKDALYRMAGVRDGWINTACIGFALRHLESATAAGSVTPTEMERFRYAFMELLDSFKGEWFSRLHDRHLVDGMLLLVGRRHLMPDYLAQDITRAALRHYGLSASFWRGWTAGPGLGEEAGWSLLALARTHFAAIEAAFATPEGIDEHLATLHAALAFFEAQRNPEAMFWQREVAAHVLRPGSAADAAPVARLLAALSAADPREAVRFLALPGATIPGGLPTLGMGPEGVRDLLRDMRPHPRGMADRAQRRLCRLLAAPDPASAATAQALAEMLAAARYHHVGADMLCLMAARSRADSVENHALIGEFGTALMRMLAEEAAPHLPAPLLAGIARLQALPEAARPAQLTTVLRLIREALETRFQQRHDEALAAVPSPAIAFDPTMIAGDVLVCVYSCNQYLDSRVAAIRETWMRDLAAVGARCIVIVGGGDDRLDGDVLRLAVSDTYEDLPQKTLRMVEWVHANTDAQYLIKIDDDCHLSVENYFGTLDYRAHHYYGRLLERPVGGTDRVWHHLKSSSERARSIDRSPEPSRYCDGGGVYSLSRHAMGRLVAASKRREGQILVARSFMEDKLVGDLLALEEIAPANTDYESYQRRRTFGAAHPIGIYENTFFPSALAPAKVAHLDLDRDQARAQALRGQAVLSPRKLWPSFTSVGTDHTAHQLELLSGAETLARVQAGGIGVVLAARNEMTMLPHLLDHYRGLGVRAFYAVDNASDDGSREWLLAQPDVVVYSATSEYRTSHYGVTWQHTVLAHHFLGRWAVVADGDEFLIYPGWRQRGLASLVASVEAEGADAVPLWMVDFYPHGDLGEADFTTRPPFEAAPWMDRDPVHASRLTTCYYSNRIQQVSALRHRLLPDSEPNAFVAEKVAMFRYQPGIRLSEGLHSATNLRLSSQRAVFAHFKYHAGFRRKIMEEIARGQHYNGAIEYRRYAAMIAESAGGFGRDGVSVRLGEDGFLPGV